MLARLYALIGHHSRVVRVLRRVVWGTWQDGFIHAGNLAYMTILALFPFFITLAAIYALIGEEAQRSASVHTLLSAMPPVVAQALEPVARDVISARTGHLLWIGGLVGLWTVSSLIETIRDILRRAYGTQSGAPFWHLRLLSGAMIIAATIVVLLSLFAQVAITAAQAMIAAHWPELTGVVFRMTVTRLLPAGILFSSVYLLFLLLTPAPYRAQRNAKWPGALLVTLWWGAVAALLPALLHLFFRYDLTYGSLAGVMIALFFFWLVGLGLVAGAELNAALVQTPDRDALGQADDRARH